MSVVIENTAPRLFLSAENAKLVLAPAVRLPAVAAASFAIAINPAGDDQAQGSSAAPIRTLRELARRLPTLGESVRVDMAAGSYPLFDFVGAGTLDGRLSLGSAQAPLVVQGALSTVASFTVGSTSGITVTASPNPGWAVDVHKGRFLYHVPFAGFPRWSPILANTSDTLTVALGATGIGGFYPLPAPSSTVTILQPTSIITPPTTNAVRFENRLFLRDRVIFRNVIFDGAGGAFSGPTCYEGTQYEFYGCIFRNYSARGLEGRGNGILGDCIFDACTEAGAEIGGFAQFNDCFIRNCNTGLRASFNGTVNLGAGSMVAAEGVAEELYNAKTQGVVNDETVRVRLSTVRDLCFLQRGGRFTKVNAPLKAIVGFGALTRNVMRFDGSAGVADLFSSATQDLTSASPYFDFAGTTLTFADYASAGYRADDTLGNRAVN